MPIQILYKRPLSWTTFSKFYNLPQVDYLTYLWQIIIFEGNRFLVITLELFVKNG